MPEQFWTFVCGAGIGAALVLLTQAMAYIPRATDEEQHEADEEQHEADETLARWRQYLAGYRDGYRDAGERAADLWRQIHYPLEDDGTWKN